MRKDISLFLAVCWVLMNSACVQQDDSRILDSSFDIDQINNEIKNKGKSVVWALNERNVDTLMHDYWKSDSAKYIINGFELTGYNEIKEGLIRSLQKRRNVELSVSDEEVYVLSPFTALHIVNYKEQITYINDSIKNYEGIWSSVYNKIKDEWKVVLVHESVNQVEPPESQ